MYYLSVPHVFTSILFTTSKNNPVIFKFPVKASLQVDFQITV